MLGQTQHYRDKLLDHFTGWLRLQGVSFEELVMTPVPDVEGINLLLEKYGRLFLMQVDLTITMQSLSTASLQRSLPFAGTCRRLGILPTRGSG